MWSRVHFDQRPLSIYALSVCGRWGYSSTGRFAVSLGLLSSPIALLLAASAAPNLPRNSARHISNPHEPRFGSSRVRMDVTGHQETANGPPVLPPIWNCSAVRQTGREAAPVLVLRDFAPAKRLPRRGLRPGGEGGSPHAGGRNWFAERARGAREGGGGVGRAACAHPDASRSVGGSRKKHRGRAGRRSRK